MADEILVMAGNGHDGQPAATLLRDLFRYVQDVVVPSLNGCQLVPLFNEDFTLAKLEGAHWKEFLAQWPEVK